MNLAAKNALTITCFARKEGFHYDEPGQLVAEPFGSKCEWDGRLLSQKAAYGCVSRPTVGGESN